MVLLADNFLAGSIISLLMPVLLLITLWVWFWYTAKRVSASHGPDAAPRPGSGGEPVAPAPSAGTEATPPAGP